MQTNPKVHRWEETPAVNFPQIIEQTRGTCVLPVGVMEDHGSHMPVGADYLHDREIVERAAAIEPVMIFPPYYFGQIYEARHLIGTICINNRLMTELLENCCDEISRNGFHKIILETSHGGNIHFIRYFAQLIMEKEKDYMVYVPNEGWRLTPNHPNPMVRDALAKIEAFHEEGPGHGGEEETSQMLYAHPELVRMGQIAPEDVGKMRDLMSNFEPYVYTGIWYYAQYPHHYAGNGRLGSAEKGKVYFERDVRHLADCFKIVKEDELSMKLYKEFMAKVKH